MLPSLSIRSSLLVSTGDQSMSSWLGGGSSVMSLGFGGICRLDDVAVAGADGPIMLASTSMVAICLPFNLIGSGCGGVYDFRRGAFCYSVCY